MGELCVTGSLPGVDKISSNRCQDVLGLFHWWVTLDVHIFWFHWYSMGRMWPMSQQLTITELWADQVSVRPGCGSRSRLWEGLFLTIMTLVCCAYASEMMCPHSTATEVPDPFGRNGYVVTHMCTCIPSPPPSALLLTNRSVFQLNKWGSHQPTTLEPPVSVQGSSEFGYFVSFSRHSTQDVTQSRPCFKTFRCQQFSDRRHSLTNRWRNSLHSSLLCHRS